MITSQRLRTLFIEEGSFAESIAVHRQIPENQRVQADELQVVFAEQVDVVVVMHSNADVALREDVDRLGAKLGFATIGLQLTPTRIICGPVVVPGRTACWLCFRKRSAQHAGTSHPYDIDAGVSGLAEGYGPHHTVIASGLLTLALEETSMLRSESDSAASLDPNAPIGGTVRTFDLVSGAVSSASTVSTDRCHRCSDRFAEARSADRDSLSALLK